MKKWLFVLTLLALVLPCLAMAMSDEQSQKLVAEEEEKAAQFTSKGGSGLITKDVIIDDMRQRRRTRYNAEKHILFHYGLPKIKQESYPQLAEIAAAIQQAAQDPELSQIKTYYIDGHCCIIGSAEFNCKLSWERAHAVIDELVKMGVPREKLEPRGYGFYYPAYSNENEGTRMLNRRCESSSDVIEVALKEQRMPCNLAGDSRFRGDYRPRPVEAPPTTQQAPATAAPSDLAETGPKGKRPLRDQSRPRGFITESEGTVKTPFGESAPAQPGRQQQSAPLPRGFKEVK